MCFDLIVRRAISFSSMNWYFVPLKGPYPYCSTFTDQAMGGDGKGKGADHDALRDLGGLPSQEEEAAAKAKAAAKGAHKGDAKKARISIEGIDNFDVDDNVLIPPLQDEIPRRFALMTWEGTASVIYDRIDAALTASAKKELSALSLCCIWSLMCWQLYAALPRHTSRRTYVMVIWTMLTGFYKHTR